MKTPKKTGWADYDPARLGPIVLSLHLLADSDSRTAQDVPEDLCAYELNL